MMTEITLAQFLSDILRVGEKLPPKIAGIAGVPRSGMIAAALLAARLNVPLYEWADNLPEPRRLAWGARGSHLRARRDGRLVVVDDIAMTGSTMKRILDRFARLPLAGFFVSVYTSIEAAGLLDAYAEIIPLSATLSLEWNRPRDAPRPTSEQT